MNQFETKFPNSSNHIPQMIGRVAVSSKLPIVQLLVGRKSKGGRSERSPKKHVKEQIIRCSSKEWDQGRHPRSDIASTWIMNSCLTSEHTLDRKYHTVQPNAWLFQVEMITFEIITRIWVSYFPNARADMKSKS